MSPARCIIVDHCNPRRPGFLPGLGHQARRRLQVPALVPSRARCFLERNGYVTAGLIMDTILWNSTGEIQRPAAKTSARSTVPAGFPATWAQAAGSDSPRAGRSHSLYGSSGG